MTSMPTNNNQQICNPPCDKHKIESGLCECQNRVINDESLILDLFIQDYWDSKGKPIEEVKNEMQDFIGNFDNVIDLMRKYSNFILTNHRSKIIQYLETMQSKSVENYQSATESEDIDFFAGELNGITNILYEIERSWSIDK